MCNSFGQVRPLFRYHGGKSRMAKHILPLFPTHRTYVELFGGAGTLLLNKEPSYAEVYNDLDSRLFNLFSVVRDHGEDLARRLLFTPFSRVEFLNAYVPSEDPIEDARKLLVRAGMGYGSTGTSPMMTGFRSCVKRSRTHPAMDFTRMPEIVLASMDRLRTVVLENRPALELISKHDAPDTLFYADPPYVHSTRTHVHRNRKTAYLHEMHDDDHRELATRLRGARGMVVLSGYQSDLYEDLFGDWERRDFTAFADGARPRIECVWLNPAASAAVAARGLFGFEGDNAS